MNNSINPSFLEGPLFGLLGVQYRLRSFFLCIGHTALSWNTQQKLVQLIVFMLHCHLVTPAFFKIIIIIFISIYYILLYWWTVSIGIKKKSDDVWGNQAHLISNLSELELHKISSS